MPERPVTDSAAQGHKTVAPAQLQVAGEGAVCAHLDEFPAQLVAGQALQLGELALVVVRPHEAEAVAAGEERLDGLPDLSAFSLSARWATALRDGSRPHIR